MPEDWDKPAPVNPEPEDVIQCRECGNMVRRVNQQHLRTDRCRYVDTDEVSVNRHEKDHLLREDHPETVDAYKEKYPDAPVISPRERQKLARASVDEEADRRKRELLQRRWRGDDLNTIVDELSDEFGVAEGTIRADWSKRNEWIDRVFGLEDAEAVVAEALARQTDVADRLDRLASRALSEGDIGEARRTLSELANVLDDISDRQMELADLGEAVSEHRVSVEGRVDHEHHAEEIGSDLSPDERQALDDITSEDAIEVESRAVDADEGA